MIIAKEKKKTNIAEYVLYMWQLEDIIRAYDFDINKIEENIISHFDQPENTINEIRDWYTNLIEMMKNEKIEKSGHLTFIENTMNEVNDLHLNILKNNTYQEYTDIHKQAAPLLKEFRSRTDLQVENEINVCFNALYGYLMLKLQDKEITKETKEAIKIFSSLLANLSLIYKDIETGKTEVNI